MSSIQFLHPNWLWALLLLAIPIIIHLFNFRRYKTVYFTNVGLLKHIKKETKSKSRLKELLVLLMRLLFAFFLILLFAQPYIPKQNEVSQNNDKVAVIIDNSFSMSAEGESGIQLEYAKRKALEIINAYPKTVKFMLVTSDIKVNQLFFQSKEEAISKLGGIQVSPFSKQLNTVLQSVENRLHSQNNSADIYLISDFQTSDFQILNTDTLPIHLVYLPTQSKANVSIDTAYFISPIHTSFSQEALVYSVHNSCEKALVNLSVEFSINDSIKSIASLDIPAESSVTDTLRFSHSKGGIQNGLLSIQDLPITFDNKLYFNYSNIHQVDAVLIDDNAKNRFTKALFKDNPFFKTHSFSTDNIDYNILENTELIVFVEDKNTSANISEILAQQVQKGAKLIHFAASESHLLTQLGLSQEKTDSSFSTLSEINMESELFQDAFKKKVKRTSLPKLQSDYCFKPNLSSLLLDDKEQAFAMEQAVQKGYLLSFSVPMNEENYDFYTHPVMVPLVYNFSAKQQSQALFYETDHSEVLFVKKPIYNEHIISIEGKNINRIPQQYNNGNEVKIILPERLPEGHYTLKSSEEILGGFSINNSRKESVRSFYSMEDLEQAGLNIFAAQSLSTTSINENMQTRYTFWYYCLIISLIFIILEMLLLLFFNRKKKV